MEQEAEYFRENGIKSALYKNKKLLNINEVNIKIVLFHKK